VEQETKTELSLGWVLAGFPKIFGGICPGISSDHSVTGCQTNTKLTTEKSTKAKHISLCKKSQVPGPFDGLKVLLWTNGHRVSCQLPDLTRIQQIHSRVFRKLTWYIVDRKTARTMMPFNHHENQTHTWKEQTNLKDKFSGSCNSILSYESKLWLLFLLGLLYLNQSTYWIHADSTGRRHVLPNKQISPKPTEYKSANFSARIFLHIYYTKAAHKT